MKILAVSDVQSNGLENIVSNNPEKLKNIDIIVSCGDLGREYLEFLVDGLNKDFYFVFGNHPLEEESKDYSSDLSDEKLWESFDTFTEKTTKRIAGSTDLHGRVEVFGGYLIAGFGGARWYNRKENQYTEKEMTNAVRNVERKIMWHRIQDKVLGKAQKEVVVISHAPILNVHDQPDVCHRGFKCFREFIDKISPLLWLHGHIHLENTHHSQITLVGQTTVVNAYNFKIIEIDKKHIQVFSRVDKQ